MASLNRVVLIGNLTRDPELRFTPSGVSVASFGLAVNRPWKNSEGQQQTDFFRIVAWRKLAELCVEYIKKGSPVAVEGRLQSRTWETQEGQKRNTVEIVAENVQFLGRRQESFEDTEEPSEAKEEESDVSDEDIPF